MDWLEGAKQLSILVGIGVALYGIDSWRREHSGKRRLELAEDALALFYEAADAIKHIRHPASFGSELSEIVQNDGETETAFTARRMLSSSLFATSNTKRHLTSFTPCATASWRRSARTAPNRLTSFVPSSPLSRCRLAG